MKKKIDMANLSSLLRCTIALLFCVCSYYSKAQKLPIDTGVLGKWPVMSPFGASLSSDGRFAFYFIDNQPYHHNTFVVKTTNNTWKKELVDVDMGGLMPFFTDNSLECIYLIHDTLYIQRLGTGVSNAIHVIKCAVPETKKNWIAYETANSPDSLTLMNLSTGKTVGFSSIKQFQFEKNGKELLVKRRIKSNGLYKEVLQIVDLLAGRTISFWSDSSSTEKDISSDYSFDNAGSQLAFTVDRTNDDQIEKQIWYYKTGASKAVLRASNESNGMDAKFVINGSPKFSKTGKWLFFDLSQRAVKWSPLPGKSQVHVWSYKDALINPDQKVQYERGQTFTAVVDSRNGGTIIPLIIDKREEIKIDPSHVTGDYVIVGCSNTYNKYWNLFSLPSCYLLSLKNGRKSLLNNISRGYTYNSFYSSPDGQYFVYYDPKQNNFYSLAVANHSAVNITKTIPVRLSNDRTSQRTLPNARESVSDVVGWSSDGRSALLYDQYDIWEVDLTGRRQPVDVTNSFGRRNHIEFRLLDGTETKLGAQPIVYDSLNKAILVAFNTLNKENGFYTISKGANPIKLSMGPYTYYMQESMKPHSFSQSNGVRPIKADSTNLWLVRRESLNEAPNYFTTSDFHSYMRITNLEPQMKYQWMKDTLITWRLPDGQMCQGILFRPENLKATKKYPVIINYYEKLSHQLNQFPYPVFIGADLQAPWFVANGYLVFFSDITYKPGITAGNAAYKTTISAAEQLSKIPYVDGTKIGLQGHSFGAYETNYIVSHSHRFAAAAEFAGTSDVISGYLTLTPFLSAEEHQDSQNLFEVGHSNFAATPWQRPDVYLDNSAVFHADQITTPLLITHNKKDNNIPWRQGVELYMALRRLKKPVWMLQYENSGHNANGADAIDYTIRLTQFFDYYLKGSPPPIWMTKGVPVEDEGSETGFALDRSGAKP